MAQTGTKKGRAWRRQARRGGRAAPEGVREECGINIRKTVVCVCVKYVDLCTCLQKSVRQIAGAKERWVKQQAQGWSAAKKNRSKGGVWLKQQAQRSACVFLRGVLHKKAQRSEAQESTTEQQSKAGGDCCLCACLHVIPGRSSLVLLCCGRLKARKSVLANF